jgi:predicted metalloenzyme YecM
MAEIQTVEDFYREASGFLSFLGMQSRVQTLQHQEVALADHVSYKCGSHEMFEIMRRILEKEGVSRWVHQAPIAGRPIAYFQLHASLPSPFGEVFYVELADQKPDDSQRDGFDHVEIYPKQGVPYDALVAKAIGVFPNIRKVERPHHTTWDALLEKGAILRLTPEPLVEKIKREEMK